MRNTIITKLAEIEAAENITILYACESGSRAWGFPSADSDYDVRFIYLRQQEWYLRVDQQHCRDVIEQPINDLLDISGWDLKKALQLLYKSNPSLIEWFNSPDVYKQNQQFSRAFKQLLQSYYSPKACFHHYSHMATGNFREYLQSEQVRIKKYFYVLRPILAMQWIEQNLGVVPMEFEVLVNTLIHNPELKAAINELLANKRQGFEADYLPRINIISRYIEAELNRFQNQQPNPVIPPASFNALNRFFINALNDEYPHA